MTLTPDLARRAAKAILAQARERLAASSGRPIWVDDPDNETTGATFAPELFLSPLAPVRPSDPADREEQLIENTIDLLMQSGCDWVGWAARTDAAEGKERTVWLRYRSSQPQPCSRCQEPAESGYVPQWPPLRFICATCRDTLRQEEMDLK